MSVIVILWEWGVEVEKLSDFMVGLHIHGFMLNANASAMDRVFSGEEVLSGTVLLAADILKTTAEELNTTHIVPETRNGGQGSGIVVCGVGIV